MDSHKPCSSQESFPAKAFFQPACFSSLECNPGDNIFHGGGETILERASSRQGLFPATSLFQAGTFSSPVQFPASLRSPHWAPLTVSLASHLFDDFPTVVWLGLATCWRRTSERTLSVGSLHALVSCFTRFHKVLGWSSCLALSNQQACVRPCCFTGRPRPLGTGFFNGYGFLATGSPRLTASLSPLSPAKLPVSYPFFPILALGLIRGGAR